MGIALPDTEPSGRSKLASVAFTAIGLAFFFGVGLAGGAAYKIYFSDDGGTQVADEMQPPAAPSEQHFSADASGAAESATEKAAPGPAPIEAAAPSAPQPPAQSTPAEATESPAMTQAAAPAASSAPPAAQTASNEPPAAPAEPQAVADAAPMPAQTESREAMPAAEPRPVPVIPPKPAMAAKAHRPAPQTTALHPPLAAHGSTAGAFRVQFGAFANEDNARRVQRSIEATGLKVVVNHDQGPSGNPLFFVRSPSYPDRAAALSAAQSVQNRAQHSANPIRIDYTIIPDHAAGEQHAQR